MSLANSSTAWCHRAHTIFGARHNFPIKAVMVINDAPGMTVMVANRAKDKVRSAADFRGKNIADGAQYGTKSVITSYLAKKAGVPANSFTPVMMESEGRLENVRKGLREGSVDVMTFQEPVTSALLESGMVTTLYDLNINSKDSTVKVLGAAFPAQSLLMSPDYIDQHGETVQQLVNALVRTMRFVNAHNTEEIAESLPPNYFEKKDKQAEIKFIRATLPTYAKRDYAFSPQSVRLVVDAIESCSFDQSEEGRWRAGGDNSKVKPDLLYDNRFVQKAMEAIKR